MTTTIALTESEPFLTAVAGQRIPRRAWAQVSEMSGLLNEAARVLQAAKRQTELLQRRAYFDGRAAGIAHAHAESIKHVLDAERQARELVAASELRIVELAISIVERIAPRLGQADLVAALASEGLAAIREERHICLRINSAAEKSVRPMLDRWQGAHPEVETVELVIDPQLDPMACVVETELGRIEVSLPGATAGRADHPRRGCSGTVRMNASRSPEPDRLLAALRTVETLKRVGRVAEARGTLIRATGVNARIGEVCELREPGNGQVLTAEVVGIERGMALLMPLGTLEGLSADTEVVSKGFQATVGAGDGLLGRTLDALGNVVDGHPAPAELARVPVYRDAPNAMTRIPIRRPYHTGVRALDTVLTVGEGQRVGIFGPAGGGKSTLLGMLARSAADVNVIVLLGGRGREVREFIDDNLGAEALRKSVIVVGTSDRPALERARAAHVGTAIAEYFRDQGKRVLLLLDSVTRFARALRDVGLAVGEPPARRGYPLSVFSALPRLFERTGNNEHGSITAFYTVLLEGASHATPGQSREGCDACVARVAMDGHPGLARSRDCAAQCPGPTMSRRTPAQEEEGDPIGDEVRSILDGHICLSRKLAAASHFPAIDVLTSASRVMPRVVQPVHLRAAWSLRKQLAKYQDVELLLQTGEYKRGSDAEADEAIRNIPAIRKLLQQPADQPSGFDESVVALTGIVK